MGTSPTLNIILLRCDIETCTLQCVYIYNQDDTNAPIQPRPIEIGSLGLHSRRRAVEPAEPSFIAYYSTHRHIAHIEYHLKAV